MRLTTRTNLATRVLMFCAVNQGRVVRSSDIAKACNASGNHLGHVIHQLQQHGFVDTLRGRSGGLQLGLQPREISIGRVFRIFESAVPFAECFAGDDNTCPLTAECRLRGFIDRAVEAFYHELDMVTLEDLVRGNCGLEAILKLAPERPARCSEIIPNGIAAE
ncbi:Rrf2 family transcriptional regulator [Hoeflea sp.]|uniref:RrF2 family transcriptional regulator n=1 Tax=Hoeflea sp. TaxID=1940281 RepID=UPI00198AD6D5|nr:Rrf2 family transcriptional regulator [Hoeflea sp.]MBC7283992.1 Rrf2 family transcriptional regulator [Hoeflea sp.]